MELLPDPHRDRAVFRGLLGKRFPEEYADDVRAAKDALWLDLMRALDEVDGDGPAAVLNLKRVVFQSPYVRRDGGRVRSLLWVLAMQAGMVADALADAVDAGGFYDPLLHEAVSGEVRYFFRPEPLVLAFWVPESLPHRRRVDAVPFGRVTVTSQYYRALRERWIAWVGHVRERASVAGAWPVDLPYLAPAAVLCVVPAHYRDLDNGVAKPALEALWRNGLLPDDDVRAVPWLLVHATRRLRKGTAVAVTRLGRDWGDPVAALTASLTAAEEPPDLAALLGAIEAVLPPEKASGGLRRGST